MIILTEKPSVTASFNSALDGKKNVAKYNGENVIITNCLGHLYELVKPEVYNEKYKIWNIANLPIIPEKYKYQIRAKGKDENTDSYKRFSEHVKYVHSLLSDNKNEKIIIATDADREGELIARIVLNEAGITDFSNCYRFWVSEALTKNVILEGMKNLKPLENYNTLALQGYARQHADWLVGMNLSPYISLLGGNKTTFNVGRVQTAVLKVIAQRNNEIQNFIATPYYECEATIKDNNNSIIKALLINPETNKTTFETLNHYINNAESYAKTNKQITIDVQESQKKIESPKLLGLTELQQLAAKLFDYSADKTLKLTQKLYEEYKCVSYPRTPSTVMGDDDVSLVKEKFELLKNEFKYTSYCDTSLINVNNKKVFDSKKLESHHALIPLDILTTNASTEERNIYNLISKYFFMAFMPPYIYTEQNLIITNGNSKYKSRINKAISKGWKNCISPEEEENTEDTQSVDFNFNNASLVDSKIVKKMTKPKKEFTESSLLAFMKNPTSQDETNEKLIGLGTPATRANIIADLQKHLYVEKKQKKFYVTDKGLFLLKLLYKNNETKKIAKINQTTLWQKALEESPSDFEKQIEQYIKDCVSQKFEVEEFKKSGIGTCPLCKKNIYEGKQSFYCEGYKEQPKCEFKIWKTSFGTTITKEDALLFLNNKPTKIKSLKSRTGKPYKAKIKMDLMSGKMELIFEKKPYKRN